MRVQGTCVTIVTRPFNLHLVESNSTFWANHRVPIKIRSAVPVRLPIRRPSARR